mgnify:CR=1 FL=1
MKKVVFIILALWMGIGSIRAQEPDTVPSTFNAVEYALQKRYRHPGTIPFDKKDWKSHTSVSLLGGIEHLVFWGDYEYKTGVMAGVSVSREMTAEHGFRASLLMGNHTRKVDNVRLNRIAIQADYLFNVTSSTKGYNPGRFSELLTILGIGYQFSGVDGQAKAVPEMHLGIQWKLHPAKNVDIFLEPRLNFLGDGIDHSTQNQHKYDISYGAMLGLTYRFKGFQPEKIKGMLTEENFLDNTFVSYSFGGQFQSSEMTSDLGTTKAMGPLMTISAGKWLMPELAIRLSAAHGSNTWHTKNIAPVTNENGEIVTEGEQFYESSRYTALRAEAMLNTLYFVHQNPNAKFSMNILAGLELGRMNKQNHLKPIKKTYSGFTGGLQLKYKVMDEVGLFFEPRITFADYSEPSNEQYMGEYITKNYTDKLFSLNVGIELMRATEENRLARSLNDELFEPYFFATASAGLSSPIHVKRYELKRYMDYQASVGIGRSFSPLSSLRLSGDYGPLTVDLKGENKKYNMISVGLDYMLNLTNMMMGYDPQRKLDVEFAAGIVGSFRQKPNDAPQMPSNPELEEPGEEELPTPPLDEGLSRTTDNDTPVTDEIIPKDESEGPIYSSDDLNKSGMHIGAQLGVHLSYKINHRIRIYMEPRIRMYGKELLMQNNVNGSDILMSVQVGAKYCF